MIKIYTDAAFQPTTHQAGLAIIIQHDGHQRQYKIHLPEVYDNHQAEFIALDQALRILDAEYTLSDTLFFYSDSKLVVQSVKKAYVKDHHYQGYLESILSRYQFASLAFIQWLPKSENKGADGVAKQALHKQGKLNKRWS